MVIRLVVGPARQCLWAPASLPIAGVRRLVGPANCHGLGRQVGPAACGPGGLGRTVALPLMTVAWSGGRGVYGYNTAAWRAITIATPSLLVNGAWTPRGGTAACLGLAAFW